MSTITKLCVENFKRISTVEINPDGSTVLVAGRNAQGKSSALDAIAVALGGGKLAPARPIRDGAESAKIEVVTSDGMKITRTFTAAGGSAIKIENGDGLRVQQPQSWLDARLGALSFDPLGFLRLKPAEQADRLRELAGVDTRPLDAEHASVFATRTDVNRDGKALAARFDAMPRHPGAERVDTAEVMRQLDEAAALERQQTEEVRKAEAHEREAAQAAADAERAEFEAADLRRRAALADLAAAALRAKRSAAVEQAADARNAAARIDVPDTAPMRAALAGAEEANRRVRENAERERVEGELQAMRARSAALSARLAEIERAKVAALEAARMPVDGLGFAADGITFKGVPLEQASTAEKLRVAVGMGLAANPEIRVILIREGSLLDSDGLALVSGMAAEAGAQVWIEVVGSGPAGAVVIEDGHVA